MKTVNEDPIKDIIDAKMFLAPLSGITDVPFRLLARNHGCRFAFTEMIDVNGIFYNNLKTLKMTDWLKGDRPLGVQLVGQDEERLLYAARVCRDKGYGLLDLNAGCPARKVVKCGKGSALMKDPKKLAKLLGKLVKALDIPVTVKIRSGWDEENKNYLEVARMAENEGVSAVSIHPRTQQQMFKNIPDHNITKEIKEALKIPVFASGNIFYPEDVKNVLSETGCDAVVAARGALGNPWIFEDTYKYLSGEKVDPGKDLQEIQNVIIEHLGLCVKFYKEYNDKRTLSHMYKHICWYFKKFKKIHIVMDDYRKLNTCSEAEQFLARLEVDERGRLLLT